MARTAWCLVPPAVLAADGAAAAPLDPERRFLRDLLRRPRALRAVGPDAAAEVFMCARVLDLGPVDEALFDRVVVAPWRQLRRRRPRAVVEAQHIALNILYACRAVEG